MSDSYHTEIIEFSGRKFEVNLYYDDSHGAPWEEHCGHGEVREIKRRGEKLPGEVIIHEDRGVFWAYDFAGAVKTAKKYWGFKTGEFAASAAESDLIYLQKWLRGDWHWCGVAVNLLDADSEKIGGEFDNALWGVESTSWEFVAQELAGEVLAARADAWRNHLKERRAVKYWASRDVMTEGAIA